MANETATAQPTADTTQTGAAPVAPALKPTRQRNEFPEAFDELEALEAFGQGSKSDKATPKAAPNGKPAAKPIGSGPPKTGAEPADKPTEPRAADAPQKPQDKAAEKPDVKTGEDAPANGEPDSTAQFKTAHDLRKDHRRLSKLVQERDQELGQLRTKLDKAPINGAVLEENKSLKKRLEEVEGELRYLDYTKSAEFKDKFEKPYQAAYEDALEEVRELQVIAPDGSTRPATDKDFQRILQAEQQDVRKLANDLFGEAANDVLAARRRLIELNRTANRESKKYREEAAQRERDKALKNAENRDNMERLWNKATKDVAENYPQFFGKVEGDDEYNTALENGYKTVEKAHDPKLSIEEKVSRLAVARHKAAAFPAKVLQLKRAEARIAELEEVVKGYEESAPHGGKGGSETGRVGGGEGEDGMPPGYRSIDDDLADAARRDGAS